jgi:hypothetical protein
MHEGERVIVFTDHGYNPTPLWSVGGSWLTSAAPISETQITWLTLVDPVLILLMVGLIWWAFGWEVLCLSLVWWGVNYPSRYSYIGGAFLRQDWLLFAIASLCLARKGYMGAAGFTLAWSAMLRVFPAFIALGLGLKILQQCWKAKTLLLTREQWRFAAGGILAIMLLFPISLTVGEADGGLTLWKAFAENSGKHLATPATNNIGLPAIVSFEPSTRTRQLRNYWITAPWDSWKEQRRRVFNERRPLYWALVAAFIVLLGVAVRRQDDWVALVLGVGAIPILSDMASYYFSVLLAYALLWPRLPLIGPALTATVFLCSIVPAIFRSEDERYLAISVIYLLFIVAVTGTIASQRQTDAGVSLTSEPAGSAPLASA